MAAIFLIEAGFRLMLPGKAVSPLPALGALRCLESIALVFLVWWLEKNTAAIGLARAQVMRGLIRGLIWSVYFGFIAAVIYIMLLLLGVDPLKYFHNASSLSWRQAIVLLLVGGLIGPVAEEIFLEDGAPLPQLFLVPWSLFLRIA